MSTLQGNHFDEFHFWIENEISTLNHFIRFKFIYNSQDLHINICELYNAVSDIIYVYDIYSLLCNCDTPGHKQKSDSHVTQSLQI